MDSNYYGEEYEEGSYCRFSEQESQYCSDYAKDDDDFWELTKNERYGEYDNDDYYDDDDFWELNNKDERYGDYDNDDVYDDDNFWELTNKDERYGDYDEYYMECTEDDNYCGDYEEYYSDFGNNKNCFSDGVSSGTHDRDLQWNSYTEDTSQKKIPPISVFVKHAICDRLRLIISARHTTDININDKRLLQHALTNMYSAHLKYFNLNLDEIKNWNSNQWKGVKSLITKNAYNQLQSDL